MQFSMLSVGVLFTKFQMSGHRYSFNRGVLFSFCLFLQFLVFTLQILEILEFMYSIHSVSPFRISHLQTHQIRKFFFFIAYRNIAIIHYWHSYWSISLDLSHQFYDRVLSQWKMQNLCSICIEEESIFYTCVIICSLAYKSSCTFIYGYVHASSVCFLCFCLSTSLFIVCSW